MKNPTIYILIFNILGDGAWHKTSEFLRPWSDDDKRLREMRHEKGWIDYELHIQRRSDGRVLYTECRIIRINSIWWDYYKQFSLTWVDSKGQVVLV